MRLPKWSLVCPAGLQPVVLNCSCNYENKPIHIKYIYSNGPDLTSFWPCDVYTFHRYPDYRWAPRGRLRVRHLHQDNDVRRRVDRLPWAVANEHHRRQTLPQIDAGQDEIQDNSAAADAVAYQWRQEGTTCAAASCQDWRQTWGVVRPGARISGGIIWRWQWNGWHRERLRGDTNIWCRHRETARTTHYAAKDYPQGESCCQYRQQPHWQVSTNDHLCAAAATAPAANGKWRSGRLPNSIVSVDGEDFRGCRLGAG